MAAPLLAPGAARDDSYGTMGGQQDVKEWLRNTSFCKAADPWPLLVRVSVLAGKQAVVLCALAFQVVFMGNNTMSCNPMEVGWCRSILCEYTKAYVRGFPLLAAMASLAVFSRMILLQRIYYRLLCRHVLLDLDNRNPLYDPLFQLVIWCLCNAFSHFFLYIFSSNRVQDVVEADSDSFNEAKNLVMSYGLPAIVFVSFFWASYDIEQTLVPLNKYWEEDPELARLSFQDMEYITEASVMKAIPRLRFAGSEGRCCTMDEAFEELKTLAQEESKEEVEANEGWRTASSMWPAKVLLDPRIQDQEKYSFTHMWRIAIVAFAAISGFVCVVFGFLIVKDFIGIFVEEPHQWTDIPGVLVLVGHATCTVYILHAVVFSNIKVLPRSWELWLRAKFGRDGAGTEGGAPEAPGDSEAARSRESWESCEPHGR